MVTLPSSPAGHPVGLVAISPMPCTVIISRAELQAISPIYRVVMGRDVRIGLPGIERLEEGEKWCRDPEGDAAGRVYLTVEKLEPPDALDQDQRFVLYFEDELTAAAFKMQFG